ANEGSASKPGIGRLMFPPVAARETSSWRNGAEDHRPSPNPVHGSCKKDSFEFVCRRLHSDGALLPGAIGATRRSRFFCALNRPMPFARVPLLVLQIGLVLAWSSGYVGAIIASDTGSVVRVLLWRFIGVAL